MRKVTDIIWGLWLVAGIALKILGLVGWGVALSAIWLPIGVVTALGFVIFITADIGDRMKKREDEKIPDTCGTCLFGKTCDLINSTKKEGEEKEKCMGERIGGATRGTLCPYYERSI